MSKIMNALFEQIQENWYADMVDDYQAETMCNQ